MRLAAILALLATSVIPMAVAAPMVVSSGDSGIAAIDKRDGSTELDPDLCPFKVKRTVKYVGHPGEGGSCPVQN